MTIKAGFHRIVATAAILAAIAFAPAHAQSLDEMKVQLKAMQKRIEQLEATQRTSPPPVAQAQPRARTATMQTADVKAARQAADQAQQAAAQAQLAAEQAKQEVAGAKTAAAAEVKAAYTPPEGKPAGSFRIPGSETVVRLYGFAKLNASWDLTTQDQSDALTAQSIQLFGSPAKRTGGGMQVSARRSRLGFETWTPVNETFGEFHSLIEMDFAGQNANLTTQATSDSYTPRLRKAYVDFGQSNGGWGSVLFGQTDTLFSDTALLPLQWLSDWTFVGIGNVRQGQFRYTYGFGDGLSASAAVEAPYSDITTATGTSYPDSNGGAGVGLGLVPDFTGRVLYKQGWGQVALRGVVRPQIELNNNSAASPASRFNQSATGYGIGATGSVNLLDNTLVLMASGNAGSGLGRYLDASTNGFGAVSNAGLAGISGAATTLQTVTVYAGMVGLQYFFTPSLRTNLSLGGAWLSLPSYASQFGGCIGASIASGTCGSTNKQEWASAINLIWSPFKAVDVGIEYQHVERELQSRFSLGSNASTTGGIANRIQVTGIGRF